MNEIEIKCPCCDSIIRILLDSSGTPAAFLVDEEPISQSELLEQFGIALGTEKGGE